MANNEARNNHKIQASDSFGEVRIADEVIATIAAMAASEIPGVASVGGNLTSEIMGKLKMNRLSKGVKAAINDNEITIDISLSIEYGYQIPATCERVQKKIKTTIENMTGFTVGDVNTHISGIDMNAEDQM